MLNYYKKHINNIYNFNFFNALFVLTAIFNGILLLAVGTDNMNFGHNSSLNNLFSICDFYLLLVYVVFLIFTVGMDFKNSMGHISLSASKSKSNDYMVKKIMTIICQYVICYAITLINIIYCYGKVARKDTIQYHLEILIGSSIITTIFVTSITLFFIVLIKDIPKTTIVVISLYFIEEYLWRGQVTRKYGILAHRFYWDWTDMRFNITEKLVYLAVSIVLLIFSYFWLGRGSRSTYKGL
ncbi:MAG: hypothetical protein Q8936_02530 [Bacillota bacterium]|nr:hypothetical protein [Bacillota bacterium]